MLIGGVGVSRPSIYSNVQERWSKGSHAVRELATAFSATFSFLLVTIVGQLVNTLPLPQQKVSGRITGGGYRSAPVDSFIDSSEIRSDVCRFRSSTALDTSINF